MIEESLIDITLIDVFKSIVSDLRADFEVTNVVASDNLVKIYFEFNSDSLNKGNLIDLDLGELSGHHQIRFIRDDHIEINYSGGFDTTGTLKAYPFSDWGDLKQGNIKVQNTNSYPLIFLITPDSYDRNTKTNDSHYIDESIQILFIDKYTGGRGSIGEANYIYDNVVSRMSALSLEFEKVAQESNYIEEITRSSLILQIPFGITLTSNQDGKTASVFSANDAGVVLNIGLKIYKQFNC